MTTTITTADTVDYPHELCPYCGARTLYLEFDEWDAATGAPTETGTHVHCTNDNGDDPNDHTDMPYVNWLPLEVRAARWAAEHIVIADRDDRAELAAWNAGEPLR